MRPYLTASTADLIDLAKAHWDDTEVLAQLLVETKHRKSKRAGMLERDLQKRIEYLAARPRQARGAGNDHSADLQLAAAKARILELEKELVATRAAGRSEADARLAKWGLASSCPPFVFEQVKRAWRKNLHPDTYADRTDADRKALEKMFQDFESDVNWLAKNGWPGRT